MAARTWTGMALGMLFVLACDETDQRDGTSPLDAGHMLEDARATPLDAEQASDDASRQQPTTGYRFIIENQSAETVYIQTVGGAGAPASVSLVEDGEQVQWQDTCELCNCGPCASCGVCGRSLAAVERIEPGASYTLSWDGNLWEQAPFSCGALQRCERSLGAPRGDVVVSVRYAGSFKVVNGNGADGQVLQEPTRTAMSSFRYVDGAESRIELR